MTCFYRPKRRNTTSHDETFLYKNLISIFANTDVYHNLHILRQLPFDYRTRVIKLCQAQYVPTPEDDSTSLWRVIDGDDETEFRMKYSGSVGRQEGETFQDIIQNLRGIERPVVASLTLDLCRVLPITRDELKQHRSKSWSKEVCLMEQDGYITLQPDWRSLFEEEFAWAPTFPSSGSNPRAGIIFRNGLKRWLRRVASVIHYPRATYKNISRQGRKELSEQMEIDLEDVPIVGQNHLQRLYMKTGYRGQRGGELRQKWYPANAKPRTYYAQGPYTYHSSAVLQDCLGWANDEFNHTSKRSKLRPTRILLTYGERKFLRVFDLESFTSRATIIREFVEHLAVFAAGTSFTYMDAREGLITEDFGGVLAEYNRRANYNTPMSYERVLPDMLGMDTKHHMAGCLGVYGNMALSTLLHGALMLALTGDEDKGNVAGDDGCLERCDEDDFMVDEMIAAMGKDQPDRRFRSDEPGCICLKRGLMQDELDRLRQTFRVIPPTLHLVMTHLYGIEDDRYFDPEFGFLTKKQHLKVICRDTYRFLRSVVQVLHTISEADAVIVVKYILWIQERAKLPVKGQLRPFWPSTAFFGSRAEMDPVDWSVSCMTWLQSDPIRSTYMQLFTGVIADKLQAEEDDPNEYVPFDGWSTGVRFHSRSTKHLKFLETLGLVKKEAVNVLREFDSFEEFYLYQTRRFLNRSVSMYVYEIVEDVPHHLIR